MKTQETHNINLAGYLISIGFKLQGTKRENGKVLFLFDYSKKIDEAINDFFMDGDVPVNTFANNLRYLKSLIYQS